ncbi:DUF2914 domain-containing protein [Deferribacterales bacterium Es71-Z0220]|jgi:hypothetical protein|uniref:DUF2914 domain-containing protein n=1 Tax=Deferrivibrio essentukiensis TaxID=2880922 RepID=UPI001F5FF8B3|nr:DUF2914 domain-containing protein [Deferrivibrio essentukiensis]MBZ4672406.1 hypothetical protein [Deferribacteraceae bacterium]MCB4205165.1 DUF2914 domain-containing protein [Deferrivibrio essentukiensis]
MKRIIFTVLMLIVALNLFAETTISRMAIATDIVDREPVGVSETFSANIGKLYCFTEVQTDKFPTKVVHIWLYDNNIIAEVPLEVNSNKWRTYSSKRILPNWEGDWKVEIYAEDGKLIGSKSFTVK